jgi:peptide/nickel transport system ATP-binding protein
MLLQVTNLTVRFTTPRASFNAVDEVSFSVAEGETLALVGESGCGKTVTALAVLRLLPPAARLEAEAITLRGRELTLLTEREMRAVRGKDLAMIFQEPLTALNPVYPVGEQIAEGLRLHENLNRRVAWERAVEALREVGIPDPRQRAREYPHQLSGGLRQRAMIAMAMAGRPSLLIADEPTTALDVSVQAQILDLLLHLQAERRMSLLLITHDLGIVAEMAHQVAVMYAGHIVEQADVKTLFARPRHPYTRGLFASIPRSWSDGVMEYRSVGKNVDPLLHDSMTPSLPPPIPTRLAAIEGTVPDLAHLPAGCRFAPRCPHAQEQCQQPQELQEVNAAHLVRCGRAKEWVSGPREFFVILNGVQRSEESPGSQRAGDSSLRSE